MEIERFELSGVVVDTGLLWCDVVLLVLWFVMFQTHCSPSKYQDPLTLQHCARSRRPESPVQTSNSNTYHRISSPDSTSHFTSLHSQTHFKETGEQVVDWTNLAQDMDKWWAVVNTITNSWIT